MGCLSELLGVFSLIMLWNNPEDENLWWIILGVLMANSLLSKVLKESLRLYGPNDSSSFFWGIIMTLIQLGLIGLSIYGVFLEFS
jgi:phosphatidylglycerophosphate synthase